MSVASNSLVLFLQVNGGFKFVPFCLLESFSVV